MSKKIARLWIDEHHSIRSLNDARKAGLMFINTKEYARREHIHVRTARHRAKQGKVRAEKFKGEWFFLVKGV